MATRLASILTALALLALGCAPASAQADDTFYKGKTLTILVGFSPGGLYDLNARLIAKHIGDYIPGNPVVTPQNMPGSGSRNLANHLYNTAPQDGTVIGMVSRGIALEALLRAPGVRFEPRNMHWIGSPSREVSVCVDWYTSPIKSLKDLYTNTLVVGAAGSGSDDDVFPKVMNDVLGTKFKIINGYEGGNNVTQAMEAGELAGRCGWSWGAIKSRSADWLRDKKIRILLQMGLEKAPDLPDVPAALDLVKKDEDRQMLELLFAPQKMAWPLVAPPGVPADRVSILRTAFDRTMKDPAFLAEAQKIALDVVPLSGGEIDALLAKVYKTPKPVVERARRMEYPSL